MLVHFPGGDLRVRLAGVMPLPQVTGGAFPGCRSGCTWSGSPVSSSVFSPLRMYGMPPAAWWYVFVSSSKLSWTTVSFDRPSPAALDLHDTRGRIGRHLVVPTSIESQRQTRRSFRHEHLADDRCLAVDLVDVRRARCPVGLDRAPVEVLLRELRLCQSVPDALRRRPDVDDVDVGRLAVGSHRSSLLETGAERQQRPARPGGELSGPPVVDLADGHGVQVVQP